MFFFLPIGIFILAVLLMAAMLVRKSMLVKSDIVLKHNTFSPQYFPNLFSSIHNLERSLLHFSFRTGGHIFARARFFGKRGMDAFLSQTPMKKISDVISGKHKMRGEKSEPSSYLKDITDHKNSIQKEKE